MAAKEVVEFRENNNGKTTMEATEIHGRVAAWTELHGIVVKLVTAQKTEEQSSDELEENDGRMTMAAAHVDKATTVAQPVREGNTTQEEGHGGPTMAAMGEVMMQKDNHGKNPMGAKLHLKSEDNLGGLVVVELLLLLRFSVNSNDSDLVGRYTDAVTDP